MHTRGIIRDLSRQWAADRFSGSEISIAVPAAPTVVAGTRCGLISSMSAEWFSQPGASWLRRHLRCDSCRTAERRSALKVRDSQSHIHPRERK